MQEIWKDIKGYKGLYQVSNLGRVKSLSRKIWNGFVNYQSKELLLKPSANHKGYLQVILYKSGVQSNKRIHRLVAEAFLFNPNDYPQVNHEDGDKQNNCVDNLSWCNNSINQRHAFEHGLKRHMYGKDNSKARKINQYDLDGNFIKTWGCIKDICDEMGIHYSSIIRCCNGTFKTCHGYKWEYAD